MVKYKPSKTNACGYSCDLVTDLINLINERIAPWHGARFARIHLVREGAYIAWFDRNGLGFIAHINFEDDGNNESEIVVDAIESLSDDPNYADDWSCDETHRNYALHHQGVLRGLIRNDAGQLVESEAVAS